MDYDTLKEIQAEEKAYQKWEREQKNLILSMASSKRKQEQWNKLFPPLPQLSINEVY